MTVTEHTQNNNYGHFPKEENGAGLQTTKSCHGPLRAMRRAVEPRMHGIGIHARPPLRRKHVVCKQCRVPSVQCIQKAAKTQPIHIRVSTRRRAPQQNPSRNRRFPAQHPLSKIKLWSTQGQSKAIGVHSSVKCTPNGRYTRLSNVFQICYAFVCQMHFNPRSLFTV